MTIFRPARETDLQAAYEVFYDNEVLDSPQPPALGNARATLRHLLNSGTMYVADQDGKIQAFAGAITRGNVVFLTDLFVRPALQSGQIGKMLLHAVMPEDGLIHCTSSSSDPRALALYIRAGMRPQWPHFYLRAEKPTRELPRNPDIEVIEADADDTELIRMDARIGGRWRPDDHAYWMREEQSIPLWFRRGGHTIGYGYLRLGAGTIWDPHACSLGPIGATTPADAAACVFAAVNLALRRADVIRIEVPGPHPCLATLLDKGFRITDVDTFVSSAATPFFDAQCYIASGGDLL